MSIDLGAEIEKNTVCDFSETLRQMQKADALTHLAKGIAHEFNNSVQGIVASLELVRKLSEGGRGAETGRFVASAKTSASRIAELNARLLEFSRRQRLVPKRLSINTVLAGMEVLLRSGLPQWIKLELNLMDGLWQTCCDGNHTESAVLNLVLNARDALPEGGTISIRTGNVNIDDEVSDRPANILPGQYVRFEIMDTGIGMSEDVLRQACDPYFTTKARELCIGLGLTMVDRYTRQYEGGLEISSKIGAGTTVALYLPRDSEAADETP